MGTAIYLRAFEDNTLARNSAGEFYATTTQAGQSCCDGPRLAHHSINRWRDKDDNVR